jgi:hypothetical protein
MTDVPISLAVIREHAKERRNGYAVAIMRAVFQGPHGSPMIRFSDLQDITRRYPVKRLKGLGDVLHWFFLPIARTLRLKCVNRKTGELKPNCPCKRRQEAINRALSFN